MKTRHLFLTGALAALTACTPDYDLTVKDDNDAYSDTGVECPDAIPDCNEEEPEDTSEPVDSRPQDTGEPNDESPPDQAPVAVCSVAPNPVTPPRDSATWDGSGSYDNNGGIITNYSWSLVSKPSGSASTTPPGSSWAAA